MRPVLIMVCESISSSQSNNSTQGSDEGLSGQDDSGAGTEVSR